MMSLDILLWLLIYNSSPSSSNLVSRARNAICSGYSFWIRKIEHYHL